MGASGAVTVGGITAATTAWSATSVTCTVPAGLTIGAKNVIVTPTGGAASNALTFTVTLPPAPTAAITSLTPNHAQTGASVVIAGTNLGSGGTVRFGTTVGHHHRLERDLGHRDRARGPRRRRHHRHRARPPAARPPTPSPSRWTRRRRPPPPSPA